MHSLMKKLKNILMSNMQSLSKYISESILASSGAGKQKIEERYKALLKHFIGLDFDNISFNDDGTIDYTGNVFLDRASDGKIPIKFRKVNGSFICKDCGLTTLEGAPRVVTRGFICEKNLLRSLKGGPEEVGLEFYCGHNMLTSLEHGPQKVGSNYECEHNALKSLKGAPKEINGMFRCYSNNITSLVGGPEKVTTIYDCSGNKLVDLKGANKNECDKFICYDNMLTSLEGCPEKIKEVFDCSSNPLKSFEHGPEKVRTYIAKFINANGAKLKNDISTYTKTSNIIV